MFNTEILMFISSTIQYYESDMPHFRSAVNRKNNATINSSLQHIGRQNVFYP